MYARFFTYYSQSVQNRFSTYFYQPEVYATDITYTPVVPSLSISHTDATEGGNILYNVNLSAATTVDIRVDYVVDHTGGTNSASSSDYTASSGTLTIPLGSTQASISVPTTQDTIDENNEHIRLTLSNAVRATIGESSELAYIIDDDAPANQPPNAVNDAVNVTMLWETNVYVLSNDSDPDGDSLDIVSVTQPSNAWVAIRQGFPPGSPDYLEVFGVSAGTDGFTYTISDGNGNTDTAYVLITVTSSGGPGPFDP